MEKITNVLFSLIPLILIVLISWLFSMMSGKAKKQMAQKDVGQKQPTGSPFLDLLLTSKEHEEEAVPQAPMREGPPQDSIPLKVGSWSTQELSAPTQISSKPIKPKWWGA
ncbi:MAG TPA: hypothetical protein VK463_12550 [Desulfomonilaceae bacterium]|nr:hypothetical protein [Desulfomonilaceae bacterium]